MFEELCNIFHIRFSEYKLKQLFANRELKNENKIYPPPPL